MRPIRRLTNIAITAIAMACINCRAEIASPNLVPNPSFENGTKADDVPRDWDTWVPFGTASIGPDAKHHKAGKHGAHIETKSDLTALLVSNKIPVAPGEKLRLTAWCRTEDMATSSDGTYGINCGFLDRNKTYLDWAKWQPLPVQNGKWFRATCEAEVPPRAAYATFQLGMKHMTGRTWWDECEFQTSSPVAIRFNGSLAAMEPGETTMPMVLLNRNPGSAGNRIRIETGSQTSSMIKLPAKTESTVTVPFNLRGRGKKEVRVTLSSGGGEQLFSTTTTATIPPLLVSEPVLPQYFAIEDGRPAVEGRLWIHDPHESRSRLTLQCRLRRAGEPDSPLLAECSFGTLPPNPITYSLSADGLTTGAYSISIELKRGSKVIASATEDWRIITRKGTNVTLNDDGFLIVDGKPFFPIGMCDCKDYEELGRAGFNMTQNYDVGYIRPGEVANNRRMKTVLEQSLENGMLHLFLVTHGQGGRRIDEEHLRRLRMFRDHPGVLCWYEEEGVARGDVPLSLIADLYKRVKTMAPERPFILGDSHDVITKVNDRSVFFPDQHMDIGIWWWYPIPITPGGRPGAYEGEEEGRGLELVPPTFLTTAKTRKPIWVAPQSYRKPTAVGRFPTPEEYRAQAYLSVIHGAKGLLYYTGAGKGGVQNVPQDGHWEYLKQLVGELRKMEGVFTAPDSNSTVTLTPPNNFISLRVKEANGKRVLLAANRDNAETSATFTVQGLTSREVPVRFEQRSVHATDSKFSDAFPPYGVRVYDLD